MKKIISFLFLVAFLYFLGAFVTLELNLFLWHPLYRLGLVFLVLAAVIEDVKRERLEEAVNEYMENQK